MKLPKLFKLTSVGAQQEWEIGTEGNVIVTKWGQVGGKIQETRDEVKEGKNVGKANETSPKQQAEAEATSQWEKKLKKGYVKSLDAADAGEVDDVIEGGISPMLAKRFDEHGDKIIYPAYVQPKFDGHRCIAIIDRKGQATLWSRTRKPITGLPHIIEALEGLEYWDSKGDVVLDGELYNHDYKNKFEELTSFIRNPEPKEGHEVVQYHIYDVADATREYHRRNDLLNLYVPTKGPLVRVKTDLASDEDELMLAFESCVAKGYEGAMVRNMDGKYVNKRSVDLQKIKEFQDDEFEIVDVEEGRGKLAGKAIFVCENKQGTRFNAKMKGNQDNLAKYFKKPALAVGRMLTVQYQGLTGKNGVPRFPVGLRFKEDL